MADEDKKRYQKAMESYEPPSSDDDDSDNGGKKKAAAKKKKKKDPNAPKKPSSAYFLFSIHIRPTIKEENPDIKFGEIAKAISERYKTMPKEEMEKWQAKADKEKVRYKTEMAAYKKKQEQPKAAEPKVSDDDDDDDSDDDSD